jgi:intracellular multiplication protein IcmO
MSKPSRIYGVGVNEDLDPGILRRDIRPLRVKFQNFFADYGGVVVLIIGIVTLINAVIPLPMVPKFFELSFLAGIAAAGYAKNQIRTYPLVAPIEGGDSQKAMDKKGLYLLGNETDDYRNLWLTSSEIRTHILVFGTTGSGKTRFLLGLLYQSMISGSGAMYTDGKGDNSVWWLVYSFARRTDRIDDLLLINYLTGGNNQSLNKNKSGKKPDHRISNTTNPLSQGTAEQLRSLLVGLMRESGGEGEMWKGRSSSMLKALLETLTVLRDEGEINLDVEAVRDFMVLDRILELTQRDDLPELTIISLKKYLLELPGFTEEDADVGVLNPECYKQHNFLTMQLTEVMSDLSGTYGHIFKCELGEVDFKDLVFNSRILFVMLPALEKDPDALAGLGKMIVAGVRAALAPALGEDVEGSRSSVIEVKPTNSLEPFILILDEYGYYAVKGFSVAAAQARSLGVGIVFAGQDYPSFTKASKEEADAIVANTTTTICMKLEDTGDTAELIVKRGGKTDVQKAAGYERKRDGIDGFKDQGAVRSETNDVIDIRDLVSQGQGEGHVIRGKDVYRSQLFFADPYEIEEAELNKFLMVNRPKRALLDNINGAFDKIEKLVKGENKPDENLKFDSGLNDLFRDYRLSFGRQDNPKESSQFAVGSHFLRVTIKDKLDEAKQQKALNPEISEENNKTESNNDLVEPSSQNPESQTVTNDKKSGDQDNSLKPSQKVAEKAVSDYETLEALSNEAPNNSISSQARAASEEFEALLAKTVTRVVRRESETPISAKEQAQGSPMNQVSRITEYDDPMTEFDIISERTNAYPSGETPRKPEQDEIMSCLASVRDDLRKKPASTETI